MLRDKAWSPYASGILIGLLQIPAFLLIETALGTSSSYVTIAAYIASLVDTSIDKMDYLAKHMYGAKNLWQVALLIGIAVGAFVSMTASRTRRHAVSPVWQKVVGVQRLSARAPMAFAGGFIMVLGARIADGCTTGHGLSGMAQLAVGSTVAVAAMFAAVARGDWTQLRWSRRIDGASSTIGRSVRPVVSFCMIQLIAARTCPASPSPQPIRWVQVSNSVATAEVIAAVSRRRGRA
jgi:uncharacterized membrane protein YedE/YeeE